jgi:hypothetical protein
VTRDNNKADEEVKTKKSCCCFCLILFVCVNLCLHLGNADEKELASQQIQIQSKRFYIDVKENQRGRFIKLAEVGVGGRKSRILMSMGAANELKQRLLEFSELHSSLGPSHAATGSASPNAAAGASNGGGDKRGGGGGGGGGSGDNEGGLIKSETIVKDRKRYYLDLKENQRGRFLRVSMVVTRGPRAYLAIPAQGLIEFKDHLSDMLERYGTGVDEQSQLPELPDSKSLRADNKTFYFDCGSNVRGVFLKISEVRQSRYRTSITIPEKHLLQFRDQINEYIDTINSAAAATASDTAQAPSATDTSEEQAASADSKVEAAV